MNHKQKIINIAVLVVAIIALCIGGYFYYQLKVLKTSPQTVAQEEVTSLIAKVSKLYLLPIGEEPTIATVSDPTALKSQTFFNTSIKGDKVLIYTKTGKAILYRPSIDKIIETAPINNTKTDIKTDTVGTIETPAVKTTTPAKTTSKN